MYVIIIMSVCLYICNNNYVDSISNLKFENILVSKCSCLSFRIFRFSTPINKNKKGICGKSRRIVCAYLEYHKTNIQENMNILKINIYIFFFLRC